MQMCRAITDEEEELLRLGKGYLALLHLGSNEICMFPRCQDEPLFREQMHHIPTNSWIFFFSLFGRRLFTYYPRYIDWEIISTEGFLRQPRGPLGAFGNAASTQAQRPTPTLI